MKSRSPVVAPSASRPPRGSPARASSDAPNLGGRDGASVRGSSDAAPLGVDDDALATAEAEAERLKERFAFAKDAREREEALRWATEAQLRVNVMRAERAFTPEGERRAAASASRALAGARRLLAELAESRGVPVPSPSAATLASPARPRASPSPSRARGPTASSSPGMDPAPVPSASPVRPARSPPSRASPGTTASPNVPAASPARRSSPGKPPVESPAPARRSASRALFPAFGTDEHHAAAVRLQRIQRGRAARARVKAMSEARRSAARGIPVDPHAPPSPTREARERARAAARLAADRVEAREWARRETLRVRQMVERAEKAAIRAVAEGDDDDDSLREVHHRATTSSRARTRPATAVESNRASTRLSRRPATAAAAGRKASPGERAARAAARRLKLKMDAEADAEARRRAADESRATSRRRVRGPGEEAFYERLDEARKSREDLAGRSRSAPRSRSLPSSAAASPLRRSAARATEKATVKATPTSRDAPDDSDEDESVRAAVLRAREAARALAEAEAAVVAARTEAKKTEARVRSIGRAKSKSPSPAREKEKVDAAEAERREKEDRTGSSATRVVAVSRSGATARGKAYAERVREMEHRKWERRAAAEEARLAAEVSRVRSDVSTANSDSAFAETESEALEGAARADAVKRDAALYARDAYRRAVTTAFHRYYDARRDGTTLVDKSFERELVSAANGMPAFRALHPRHLARVFASATMERHPAGSVVCREGERGECVYVVVGGELALFRRRDGANRDRPIVADDSLWDFRAGRDRRAVSRRAGGKPPGSVISADPGAGSVGERPLDLPGAETEARSLGAPRGAGSLARRVKTGEAFGAGAVLRPGGEARAATATALSDATLLALRKWKYDAVMDTIEKTEAARTAAFLRSTELFPVSKVSDADLRELATRLDLVVAEPGDAVVVAGDVARGVFFVREGRARVFAKALVMVPTDPEGDEARRSAEWRGSGGSNLRSSLRSSASSATHGSPLRRRSGTGGGAPRRSAHLKTRDVPLGELVAPALFGEECLVPYVYPEDQGGGVGPGRHAFTVAADEGGRLTAMRLPPDAVDALPRNVARRLMQLAKSTNAASVEAREALNARPNAVNANANANHPRVAFGTSTRPPAPLVDPRRSFVARDSVEDGRAPVGVGLGGGGGRTREVAEAGKRRQAKRTLARPATAGSGTGTGTALAGGVEGRAGSRPRTAGWTRETTREGAYRYDAFIRGPPSREGIAAPVTPTPTGRTHAEVAAAATREARSAERRLREFRATAPSGIGGRAGAGAGSGSGAGWAARQNTPPAVRMTKKAAALAEKNKPRERFKVPFPWDADAPPPGPGSPPPGMMRSPPGMTRSPPGSSFRAEVGTARAVRSRSAGAYVPARARVDSNFRRSKEDEFEFDVDGGRRAPAPRVILADVNREGADAAPARRARARSAGVARGEEDDPWIRAGFREEDAY